MVNDNNFEEKIRRALLAKGSEIEPSEQLFSNIMMNVNKRKGGFFMFQNTITNLRAKKVVAASICLVLGFSCISLATSSNARAFAVETTNKILTIFTVKKDGKIVEAQSDKALLSNPSCSIHTEQTDGELTQSLGFKVSYPDSLNDNFKLVDKAQTITLGKEITYDNWQKLNDNHTLELAIDDSKLYNALSQYKPFKHIFGIYKNEKYEIAINISHHGDFKDTISKKVVLQKTNINAIDAKWVEETYPHYPLNPKTGGLDLTQKPVFRKHHSLEWTTNDADYSIFSDMYLSQDLTYDEAVKIAQSFIGQ
ncbi:MAG: hypothetical protein Q8936_02410 [Bacillota bacterium]|nr:hypothetical protein [Bacillota bacterium]